MDEQNNNQQPERQETAEEKRLRYMTDEERREWSGLSEWRDPLEKEPAAPPDETGDKLALASLLCGIVSVLIGCLHISSVLFGIAAVTCGILAKKKYHCVSGLATAGIVLGCVCFGLFLIREVWWVLGRLFPPENVNPNSIIHMPDDLASEVDS